MFLATKMTPQNAILDPATLRARAAECERLARESAPGAAAEAFRRLAREYAEMADRLERSSAIGDECEAG
jgi:hypothetical protein